MGRVPTVAPWENKNLLDAYKNKKDIIGMEYIVPNLNKDALHELKKNKEYIK